MNYVTGREEECKEVNPTSKHDIKLSCYFCSAIFSDGKILEEHLKETHHYFYCNVCDKKFYTLNGYNTHKIEVHKEMVETPTGQGRLYICTTCGKVLQSLSRLQVHERAHTDARPYSCHLCEKAYKYKNKYVHHMTVAHGIVSSKSAFLKDSG